MKSRLQKIEDVTDPQVGRFYLVPCVEALAADSRHKMKFWPVIGPWHEDADIAVEQHHFHFDVRFFPRRVYERFRLFSNPENTDGAYNLGRVHVSQTGGEDTRVYRRLKLRRPMPEFPFSEKVTGQLQPKFKDVTLKCLKCPVCPHRGMSLQGLPVAADGTVVCNGHGLKWNLHTGRPVTRLSTEQQRKTL